MLLHILAIPKSSRNEIVGVRNGRLVVKVTAPPEDGKANGAIVKLLAKELAIAPSNLQVISGWAGRPKTILAKDIPAEYAVGLLMRLTDL